MAVKILEQVSQTASKSVKGFKRYDVKSHGVIIKLTKPSAPMRVKSVYIVFVSEDGSTEIHYNDLRCAFLKTCLLATLIHAIDGFKQTLTVHF